MTSRAYTVETRGAGAIILGGPARLTSALISELLLLGIRAVQPTSRGEIDTLRLTHDLDFVVMFEPVLESSYLTLLAPLISSGESRLVVVEPLSSKRGQFPLAPIAKRLLYSDYLDEQEISSPLLLSWLTQIQTNQTLTIPGDGLTELSLLGLSDLAHCLALALVYPTTHNGDNFIIGNPTPISLLNLAYLIQTNLPFKINPSFDADAPTVDSFINFEVFQDTLGKLGGELKDSPEQILATYLKTSIKARPSPPPRPALAPSPPPAPTVPLKRLTPLQTAQPFFVPLQSRRQLTHSPHRPLSIISRGLIIALALYLTTIIFSITIAGLSLRRIFASLRQDELPASSSLNRFAITYLQANWSLFTSLPVISQQPVVVDTTTMLDVYSQSLSALTTAQALSQSTQDLMDYVFGSGSSDVAQVVSLSRLQAEELYQKLSLLDGSLPAGPPSTLPARYHSTYLEAKTKLGQLKRSVTTTKALLATAPDVIGLGGRRKYGVLFQNNMELRATGGFIGSFAILSFENGKLYDMPIYDVYDADGQLKGHVEPPAPIKDILGEANWYLRDSNFDPDFPTSARRAEWFIKKSLNQDLDGTIAINVNTLVSLLQAVGPLEVSDYNETITSDNLYERSQFHAEVNFFPGSTQKKEFLSTVANTLFTRFPLLSSGEGLKLVSALSDSIQEKNTLVSLVSAPADHVFKTLGWNGELNDFPCPTVVNCHKDYAMVVDSNFGVNKANYFIKRNVEEVITFDKNLAVSHVLRLFYQNTATSTAWPAGPYKNYQRLYLPIGSTISQVRVGERVLDPKEYTISSEHAKLVLAYLVTVPINTSLAVQVEYTTPQLSQDNNLTYTWYWQKQPGTSSSDSLTVYLNYPMYLSPGVISPPAELAPQQLKFDFLNDTDHRVTVKFSK